VRGVIAERELQERGRREVDEDGELGCCGTGVRGVEVEFECRRPGLGFGEDGAVE